MKKKQSKKEENKINNGREYSEEIEEIRITFDEEKSNEKVFFPKIRLFYY